MSRLAENIAVLYDGITSFSIDFWNEVKNLGSITTQILQLTLDIIGISEENFIADLQEKGTRSLLAQPAVIAANWALTEQLQLRKIIQENKLNVLTSGYSLGLFNALLLSGVVDFTDIIQLINQQSKFMEAAIPNETGGMAVIIGPTTDQVEEWCQIAREKEQQVWVSVTSGNQNVVSGTSEAIDYIKSISTGKFIRLPVSGPFHCPLQFPAVDEMVRKWSKIRFSDPFIPCLGSYQAKVLTKQNLKATMFLWICRKLEWDKILESISKDQFMTIYILGKDNALFKNVKRSTSNQIKVRKIYSPDDLAETHFD